MKLLRTVKPEEATGTVAAAYAAFDRAGEVPLPMQVLSASPGLQELQLAMVHYYRSHARLGFPLLSAIRYVAARLRGHEACVAFNRRLLGQMGMTPEEVEALISDDGPVGLDERESALLAFVRRALVAPEHVNAEELESLRRLGFVDGDILDALAHGLNIVAVSSLLRAFART